MAYDEALAERIREIVAPERGITERRMFGGLAFLVDGALAVTASGRGGLMVRVDPAVSEQYLDDPTVERMVMRGREMAGWLLVAIGADDDGALERWVRRGLEYARSVA